MEQLYEVIAASMKIEAIQVEAVMTLLREGSTVPFIARYRKERTKGLDEEQIRQIEEAYQYQEHLGKRKEDVLRLIDQQGMLTQELADAINACEKLTQVEDRSISSLSAETQDKGNDGSGKRTSSVCGMDAAFAPQWKYRTGSTYLSQ